ncbi:hypothetical protein ABPG74_015945 [Tetrahymena malaccensis]
MIDSSLNKINLLQLYSDSIDQQILQKYSQESEKSFLSNNNNEKVFEEEQIRKLQKRDYIKYRVNSQSKIQLTNQEANNEYKTLKGQLNYLDSSNFQKNQFSNNQQRNSSPNIASIVKDENLLKHYDKNAILDFEISNKQNISDKYLVKNVGEGEKQQILQKQNHQQNMQSNLGSKYSDIIRRKQTLQMLSNHNENKLILQYDKYLNTHIYDNKFILQRQKQIKQDQDLYTSQRNQDQNILRANISQQFKKNLQLCNFYKDDEGDSVQKDIRMEKEKQNGFLSERLHYNETELMSIKKSDHIKERNKMRQLKFNSNLNQSMLNGLAVYQNNLKGGGCLNNQNSKIGTFRSKLQEKSLVESKLTSRNTLNEEYKLISLEQILPSVKTQKMANINDDFHKMTFTQKKAYYKEILFSQKNPSSMKLSSDFINDQKSLLSQNQTIFKENFEKQKIIQESLSINKKNNNSHNTNIQPFSETLLNKQQPDVQPSTIEERYLVNNNKQKQGKEDLERKQYLRKDFLESRKKVILQKDIQEQVAKLTQLKNPQEYSQIYKLLNIQEERDNTNTSQHIKEHSISTKNKTHNCYQDLSTPKRIGLLILTQAQQSNQSLFENKSNKQPQQQQQKIQLENSNQINQGSPKNNVEKLIIYSSSEKNVKPQKFITKDEYLNEWVNGLQGLEIDPKQNNNYSNSNNNNLLEGEEEDENELNFFLKSQNFQQNQRNVLQYDKQTKVRNSISREIQKSQINQTEKKYQQQDASNSNNKTILKILSYQSNKQQPISSDSKIKLESQIQSKQTDQQTQAQYLNEKAISASSFDNNDFDNQISSQQYGSRRVISEMKNEPKQFLSQKSQKNIEIKNDLQNGDLISFNQQNIIEELKLNTKSSNQIKKLTQFQRKNKETQKELPQILDGIQMQINQRVQTKKQ